MKISIRWKLIFFVAGVNLFISAFLAYTIFKNSYNMFFDSFLKNKLNFIETVAESINGDIHKQIDSLNDMSNPEYLRIQKYLNKIKQNDSSITYLYTINFNPEDEQFYYCLYADYATDNIFWFETDQFAFEIHFDSLQNNYILYQQNLFTDNFSIEMENYKFDVSVKKENNSQFIYIDNKKFAEVGFNPFVCKIDSVLLDTTTRYYECEFRFGEENLYSYSSISFTGEPLSNPGDIMEETEQVMENYTEIFASGKSYVETEIVESAYGKSITAYAIIRDSNNTPVALACADIYEKELTQFKKSITRISALIAIASVLLIIIVLPVILEFLVIRKIKKINYGLNKIASKELDTRIVIRSKDEFQNVAEGFNSMAESLKSFYENLEEKVRLRTITIEQQKEELNAQAENLREYNNLLNVQNEILQQQKEEISSQKDNLEDAYKEISIQKNEIEKSHSQTKASINYAFRIQQALLPKDYIIGFEHFIFFKPRDIVSGDFYFFKKSADFEYFAVADCTGHGVPGAFMSMLGISFINEIVSKREFSNSALILNELRIQIKNALHQSGEDGEQQDGMDIAFGTLNSLTLEISFAGANNPCWIFRNSEIISLQPDNQPIGIYIKEKPFTEQKFQLLKGDVLYLFTDGYESQFGGLKNEKFKTKNLKFLFSEINTFPLSEQKQIIENKFLEWKGNLEQTDDVLVVGIKI